MATNVHILIGGPAGSGKSTIARIIANALDAAGIANSINETDEHPLAPVADLDKYTEAVAKKVFVDINTVQTRLDAHYDAVVLNENT